VRQSVRQFAAVMIAMIVSMIWFFRRKRWP
jgi:hypothetical protein